MTSSSQIAPRAITEDQNPKFHMGFPFTTLGVLLSIPHSAEIYILDKQYKGVYMNGI